MDSNVDYSKAYTVTIERLHHNDPWGLRLRGGSDVNEPITVHQVRRKSPASKSGVKEGDLVSIIDNQFTSGMTHQQIIDILASPLLTLQLTLTRQTPPTEPQTAQDEWSFHRITERRQHKEPLLSTGFLAYLPLRAQHTPSPATQGKRQALYNLSHRTQVQQPLKSYQPFDMLGGTNISEASTPYRTVHQVKAAELQKTGWQWQPTAISSPTRDSADGFGTPSAQLYTNNTTPQNSWPTYQPVYQPVASWSHNRHNEDFNIIDTGCHGPPKQSKSFVMIESALAVQGAGENGLPPLPSAVADRECQEEPRTEWL